MHCTHLQLQVIHRLRQQLRSEHHSLETWNPQQDHPIFGPATFNPQGLLLAGDQLLAADNKATSDLVEALITGEPPRSSRQQGALLPVFQQGCQREVTSCQNIVIVKSSRTGMLLLPYNAQMLLQVVMACKKQQQQKAGHLNRGAARAMQVGWLVFG